MEPEHEILVYDTDCDDSITTIPETPPTSGSPTYDHPGNQSDQSPVYVSTLVGKFNNNNINEQGRML